MAYSHFQNGFSNGVTIRGLPLQQVQPGKVWYVGNSTTVVEGGIGGSNGNKGSYQQPFSTLDYAIGRCTAGRGDVIFVLPGHAETISSATALNLDVAGVAIIGLGVGTSCPTFTLDTAASTTIPVSANNITMSNCRILANYADITSAFTLTTAKNFCLDKPYIGSVAANMNFLSVIDTDATTNNADGLYIDSPTWIEPDLATLSFIKCDGINDGWTILNPRFVLGVKNNTASLIAIATGKYLTSLLADGYNIYRLSTDSATGALLITTDSSSNTGIIAHGVFQHADTASEVLVTASSGFGFHDNRSSGVAGASTYLLPAADS